MLSDQIHIDYITAFKAKDKQKSLALNTLVAAIKNAEIDKRDVDKREGLSDEEVVKVLRSELKKREEAIELYQKGNRPELAAGESFEATLIKTYLPAQMSAEEISKIVADVKAELGSIANFGQIMQSVMKKLAGKADGKLVAEIVKQSNC
jgi:uncharacterized protein